MATPNPELSKPATAASRSTSTSTAEPQKPDCWTAQHDDELKLLARRGEDAPSIVELMVTDYPCLVGKLTPEWVKEKIKDVGVAA